MKDSTIARRGSSCPASRASSFGGGSRIEWRAFAEQERNAAVKASFVVNGSKFPANFVARRDAFAGVGARVTKDYGLDPAGLRVFTDLRARGGGERLDVRARRARRHRVARTRTSRRVADGVGRQLGWRAPAAAILVSRRIADGARAESRSGAERQRILARHAPSSERSTRALRPTLFADMGWVGDRTKMSEVGRPMSGVGAGVSFLDGLFRFDVARGLYPLKQFRVDLYLEAKF